jgi:hypothetical protein
MHGKSSFASTFDNIFDTNYFQTHREETCFSFFMNSFVLYLFYSIIFAAQLIFTLSDYSVFQKSSETSLRCLLFSLPKLNY